MFKKGLVRSSYTLNVSTPRATFVLEYKQATVEELIEHSFQLESDHILVELYKFIESHCTKVIPRRFWYSRKIKKSDLIDLGPENIEKLRQKIQETRFKMPKLRPVAETDTNPPFETMLAFLCNEGVDTYDNLLKKYTLEQCIIICRALEYNANMATDEGKTRNRIADAWEEMGDEDKALQEALEFRKKRLSSKKS